jgi:hypothetical protein
MLLRKSLQLWLGRFILTALEVRILSHINIIRVLKPPSTGPETPDMFA